MSIAQFEAKWFQETHLAVHHNLPKVNPHVDVVQKYESDYILPGSGGTLFSVCDKDTGRFFKRVCNRDLCRLSSCPECRDIRLALLAAGSA